MEDSLLEKIKQLEADAMIMALRLMGEDEDTMAMECSEVMRRWKPKCLDMLMASG